MHILVTGAGGHLGHNLVSALLAAGHRVLISGSGDPQRIALTTEVLGDGGKVTGLTYNDRGTGESHKVELEGIFVQIGLLPNSEWLKGTLALSPRGEIIVDARGETSLPGVFAAGDVKDHVYKQAITSAGSGCMAAIDAERWLIEHGE